MDGPMSDEMLAMIRRTWDGVDAAASKLTVTNTKTPGQLLHALSCAPRDVPRLLAEVDRLRLLESGTQKAWTNAGAERDRAVEAAADAQTALAEAQAAAEAAQAEAAYWQRQAGRLRGAWESARRGRRQERAQQVEREIERDDALAEFNAERESNDALRTNRDQLHAELGAARDQMAEIRSHAERLARSGDPCSVQAGRALLDIVGPATVPEGTPPAMQACPHRDFDDPTRCLICHP